jgi:hypothetical protein
MQYRARQPATAGATPRLQHFVRKCVLIERVRTPTSPRKSGASEKPLQHRQAARFRAARERLVERCDLAVSKLQIAGGGVVGGV